jgi:hypothetical protein
MTVDEAKFTKRLAQLCLGSWLPNFPKRRADSKILLLSIAAELGDDPVFPERSVDAAILRWLAEVGHRVEIDHVNIRRRLVDEGYLTRSRDGRQYRRTERAIPVPDSRDIIHQALEDRETEARRQAAAKRHPLGPR